MNTKGHDVVIGDELEKDYNSFRIEDAPRRVEVIPPRKPVIKLYVVASCEFQLDRFKSLNKTLPHDHVDVSISRVFPKGDNLRGVRFNRVIVLPGGWDSWKVGERDELKRLCRTRNASIYHLTESKFQSFLADLDNIKDEEE